MIKLGLITTEYTKGGMKPKMCVCVCGSGGGGWGGGSV